MLSAEVIAILVGLALAWGPISKGLMTLVASIYFAIRGIKKVRINYIDINGVTHVKVVYAANYDHFITSLIEDGCTQKVDDKKSDGEK
jgi:hypothetical protein